MSQPKEGSPGSSKTGEYDLRSSDLSGPQADAVKSHSDLASDAKKPATSTEASGEVAGALRDQVGH